MRGKDLLLSAFVVLTLFFASATAVELGRPTNTTTSVTGTATSTLVVTSTTWVTYTSTVHATGWPLVYSSGVASYGLQLVVMLNSSVEEPGGTVRAEVLVTNTLNQNVTLAVPQDQNISEWEPYDYICPSGYVVGFALFSGHYTTDNVSKAGPPLQLAAPIYPPCPAYPIVDRAVFLPNSDRVLTYTSQGQGPINGSAQVYPETSYCSPGQGSVTCGSGQGLFGYWNSTSPVEGANATTLSKEFAYFPAGEYTLVATDAWNQFVYTYFVVL